MAKRGKVSKIKRKGLTMAQKRRGRIVSAIGRNNKKRDKSSKLSRGEFWDVYREINAGYSNTTEAVRAIRQGKFSVSGKSVKSKGKKGTKKGTKKIPERTKENTIPWQQAFLMIVGTRAYHAKMWGKPSTDIRELFREEELEGLLMAVKSWIEKEQEVNENT
jgi:hypothetical protein